MSFYDPGEDPSDDGSAEEDERMQRNTRDDESAQSQDRNSPGKRRMSGNRQGPSKRFGNTGTGSSSGAKSAGKQESSSPKPGNSTDKSVSGSNHGPSSRPNKVNPRSSSGAGAAANAGSSTVQRGGLGVPSAPPSNVQRGGLGNTGARFSQAAKAAQALQQVREGDYAGASKILAQEGAKKLLMSPYAWVVIGIIILIIIIIALLVAITANHCNTNQQPQETLKVQAQGPTTARAGDVLNYNLTISDTQPDKDITIVAHIPDGVSLAPQDVTSNWRNMQFDPVAKTVTWKASANMLPPPPANPPPANPPAGAPPAAGNLPNTNFNFTLTLKAVADNTNLIVYADANPQRGDKGVIVLDPGHSGTDISSIDPATGLQDHDYPNTPEIQEVFDVAQKVKQKLEADGYTVIMTKNAVNDSVSHRARADIANNAHAALAVSIHNDHSQPNTFAQVFVQKVGLYRETNGKRVDFTNNDVAGKSQQYGQIFAQERTTAEGHPVSVTDNSFDNRPGIAPGNIALVQLFATVPWVYNEVGASNGFDGNKYAQGISAAIEKAVPATGAAPGQGAPAGQTGGQGGCAGNAGGGGAPVAGFVAANKNNCPGQPSFGDNPLGNYGNPNCSFSKDKLNQRLQQMDPANAAKWSTISPCESSDNPNAEQPPAEAVDHGGAWGLFQMGSATPPGAPPPAPGKNGPNDRGDVNWELQVDNAIAYQKASGWGYWQCAK